MPYENANDTSLPEYIIKQPPAIRARWIFVFNKTYEEHGEEMAFIVANKWLLRESKKSFVARSKRHIVHFNIDDKDGFIKRDEEGNDYISFVLTDTTSDPAIQYTPELLKGWADSINGGNYIVGDFNHREYDLIMATSGSAEEIGNKLKEKKGIAKAVKAVYEKGKLWVKALIDKRYKNKIKQAGVSLEANIPEETMYGGQATEGDLFGFSFIVGEAQGNPIARVSG